MNPHYELPWPPHSVLIFSHAPPTNGHFFGVTPPFKGDIIIIKPDMYIFCSVQYDLYYLFNVKLTSSPQELMESLSFLSLSSLSLLLYSSSSLSLSCKDLYQLFLSVVFAALMDQGLQDSFGEANALRLPFTLSFLGLSMCWCIPWCLRYLLSSGTQSCFSLVESSHRSFQA